MVRIPFNGGWTVKPRVSGFSDLIASGTPGVPVTLPHDAMMFVNGSFAGHRPNGYVPFTVALDPYLACSQATEIAIELRDRDGNLASSPDRLVTVEVRGPTGPGSITMTSVPRASSPSLSSSPSRLLAGRRARTCRQLT